MSLKVNGYAAQSAESPLGPFSFERRDPRADDVVLDILYCGVCHSDIHQARNEWNNSTFPMVPGHEIIGRVAAIGAGVTKFQVGDLAGVGCMVDSCGNCDPCHHGAEQYCENGVSWTYNSTDRRDGLPTFGGYSTRFVVREAFAVKLPAALDPKTAAPLLCAGITTYSPLRQWKAGPDKRIAVVGLGGLGHMALKFAKAFAAKEVALFTRSPGKEAEARRLGADDVILSTDKAQMKAAANRFDLIINTVPHPHDINPYVGCLALDGTQILVGLIGPVEPTLNAAPLIGKRRSIAGSLIGGIAETQEMLDFCGQTGVTCDVEVIAMADINQAYERMLKSDVRYRFVIDCATI